MLQPFPDPKYGYTLLAMCSCLSPSGGGGIIRYLGGGWSFCLAISLFHKGDGKLYFFHLRIGCISIIPYGQLFISPIFHTKIFISKTLQPPPPNILMVAPLLYSFPFQWLNLSFLSFHHPLIIMFVKHKPTQYLCTMTFRVPQCSTAISLRHLSTSGPNHSLQKAPFKFMLKHGCCYVKHKLLFPRDAIHMHSVHSHMYVSPWGAYRAGENCTHYHSNTNTNNTSKITQHSDHPRLHFPNNLCIVSLIPSSMFTRLFLNAQREQS